jgi:hypothetical protein
MFWVAAGEYQGAHHEAKGTSDAAAARAQTVSDSQTGLAVTPPLGYTARAAPPSGRYTAVIEVKRDRDRDTGCKVAFHPIAQNSGLNQAQINARVGTSERRAIIESTLGTLYQVTAKARQRAMLRLFGGQKDLPIALDHDARIYPHQGAAAKGLAPLLARPPRPHRIRCSAVKNPCSAVKNPCSDAERLYSKRLK